jgi:hypothetical protein
MQRALNIWMAMPREQKQALWQSAQYNSYNSMMSTLACIVPRAAKRRTYEHTRGFRLNRQLHKW